RIAKGLKRASLVPSAAYAADPSAAARRFTFRPPPVDGSAKSALKKTNANRIVAIAASTGGPTALTRVLSALPANIDAGIVIVQHMPPRFTKTFAERLDKQCKIDVAEVGKEELVKNGAAYVAPGESSIELNDNYKGFTISPVSRDGTERYVPSADRLFTSVAIAAGHNTLGVVLTGMGDDGSRGAKQLASVGGKIIAEDESTAIIPGMPQATIATGIVHNVVPLNEVASLIISFAGTL
ncbi:MAG: chemotaxis protein CheB, partial [Proteobacteria bacterium]|nr:chemotaxis protein CheB [Pseudomonadota bacterium]